MALAILFDSVGAGEWFILLAVVLIVVGPKRLPEVARQIGSYYSKFRRAAENFKRQLLDMDAEFTRPVQEAFKVDDNPGAYGESTIPSTESAVSDPEPEVVVESQGEGHGD